MIRAGRAEDLQRVAEIQAVSPGAAQWELGGYHFAVAELDGVVAGFAAWRGVGDGEWELLNIAVDPAFRRRGLGRALVAALPAGRTFIEVRESNAAARALYVTCGFVEWGVRRGYYKFTPENGIVMELQK